MNDRAPVGSGASPNGRWELRALLDTETDTASASASLAIYVTFWRDDNPPLGSFGCSGIGLANEDRPVVLSVSGDRPAGWSTYVGQVTLDAERVELELADGSTAGATLAPTSDLPVRLWIGFTDSEASLRSVHALTGNGSVKWPGPRRLVDTLTVRNQLAGRVVVGLSA